MACLAIVVAIQANENSFKLWQRVTRVCMRNTMMRKDENDENVMAAASAPATTTTTTPHKSHAISWERSTNERQYSGRKVAYFKMPQLSMFRPSIPLPQFVSFCLVRPMYAPWPACAYCTRWYVIRCINEINNERSQISFCLHARRLNGAARAQNGTRNEMKLKHCSGDAMESNMAHMCLHQNPE